MPLLVTTDYVSMSDPSSVFAFGQAGFGTCALLCEVGTGKSSYSQNSFIQGDYIGDDLGEYYRAC